MYALLPSLYLSAFCNSHIHRPSHHAPFALESLLVILSLQHPSGVFAGDTFGELDTRFLYCAVSALSLLGALDQLDRDRTVAYLVQCRNFDGGFGSVAGAESHAAQGVSQGSRPVFAFFLIVFASDIDSTT